VPDAERRRGEGPPFMSDSRVQPAVVTKIDRGRTEAPSLWEEKAETLVRVIESAISTIKPSSSASRGRVAFRARGKEGQGPQRVGDNR